MARLEVAGSIDIRPTRCLFFGNSQQLHGFLAVEFSSWQPGGVGGSMAGFRFVVVISKWRRMTTHSGKKNLEMKRYNKDLKQCLLFINHTGHSWANMWHADVI